MPMKVHVVHPFGYCQGVISAMEEALAYAKAHQDEDIYMLGMMVHNEDAVSLIASSGVHVLSEKDGDLLSLLKGIPDGATLIFSAHGHPPLCEEIAKAKRLKVVDTTCVHVQENVDAALKVYEHCHDIIYIGVKGHLESEGFLAHFDGIGFYDVPSKTLFPADGLDAPNVYAQTTLGYDELYFAMERIRKQYPDAVLAKGRCLATSMRQDALRKTLEERHCDALLVLGSKTSNNSKKLAEIGQAMGIQSYLCLNLEEVKSLDFSSYQHLAFASGASTSRETCLEVLDYLSSLG